MKKKIYKLFTILILFFLFGCKITPIENNKILSNNFQKKLTFNSGVGYPELKVYFPSFMLTDKKTKKIRMVQGDGTIIILPDEKVLLIDCFDGEGGKDLVQFLRSLGINKIDYFIASHNHADHFGSVPELIKNFPIHNYYWNGVHFNSTPDFTITEAIEKAKLKTTILKKGDSIVLNKDLDCRLEVLWPELSEQDIHDAFYNPGKTERLKNNTSLVIRFWYKDFNILFTGDIYKQAEKSLVEIYSSELKSTILKVPHHGDYYTANSLNFIKAVAPDMGIILDNQYINSIISLRYKKAKVPLIYRNTGGYILITSNGLDYNFEEHSF